METGDFFKKENISYVFSTEEGLGRFIAETGDMYSEPIKTDVFGRDWAWGFPSGRYVITVYQRYSVFEDGKRIFMNANYEDTVGKYSRYGCPVFAVVCDTEKAYTVPTWKRPLISHFIRSEKDALQVRTFSLEDAEETARSYSEGGRRAAVLEWYEDHDMY
ncbi:MAG: hypothetical protein J5528_06505 [Firmicutes bacterium]|nr:hypothetical protein [Bacillota bacterium]